MDALKSFKKRIQDLRGKDISRVNEAGRREPPEER
jgi:hypothetical protein